MSKTLQRIALLPHFAKPMLVLTCFAFNSLSVRAQSSDAEIDEAKLPFEWFIAGTVEDEQGNRLAGAKVEAVLWNGRKTTESGPDGKFLLPFRYQARNGFPLMAFSADGKLASFTSGYGFTNETRKLFRLVLKPVQHTTVQVNDGAGKPVEGATVDVVAEEVRVLRSVKSDEKGQVQLELPMNANINWITARKAGVGFDYYENYDSYPTISTRPLPPAQIDLTLDGSQTARIQIVDQSDNPLGGIGVVPLIVWRDDRLGPVNAGGIEPDALTGDDGIVEIDWLPTNLKRHVSFDTVDEHFHVSDWIVFQGGSDLIQAKVFETVKVAGTAKFANGTPAAGIRIQGEGRGNTNRYYRGYTITDAEGRYELDIYPHQSTIITTIENGVAAKSQTGITLKSGQVRDDVDLTVTDGTVLSGTVSIGVDHKPIAGETATLIQNADGAQLVRWSETNEQGQYKFCVGPGKYELRLPGVDWLKPILLDISDQKEVVNNGHMLRKERTILAGQVVDEAGVPITNCEIYGESIAASGHAGFHTRSTATGEFSSERWSDRMVIYAINTEKHLAGHEVISEDDSEVKVMLHPAAMLSGPVVNEQGTGLPNLRVIMNISFGLNENRTISLTTTTDDSGRFTYPAIAPETTISISIYDKTQGHPGPSIEVETADPIQIDPIVLKFASNEKSE